MHALGVELTFRSGRQAKQTNLSGDWCSSSYFWDTMLYVRYVWLGELDDWVTVRVDEPGSDTDAQPFPLVLFALDVIPTGYDIWRDLLFDLGETVVLDPANEKQQPEVPVPQKIQEINQSWVACGCRLVASNEVVGGDSNYGETGTYVWEYQEITFPNAFIYYDGSWHSCLPGYLSTNLSCPARPDNRSLYLELLELVASQPSHATD